MAGLYTNIGKRGDVVSMRRFKADFCRVWCMAGRCIPGLVERRLNGLFRRFLTGLLSGELSGDLMKNTN